MKIAIDISQIAHEGTGVARYVTELVNNLLINDNQNQYLLFGYSLRKIKTISDFILQHKGKVEGKILPVPPTLWEMLFNNFHQFNIENIIGNFDIIHTSDWVEPPSGKIKISTIHDLLPIKHPEFFPKKIVNTQIKRLHWIQKESKGIVVDSQSTKSDCLKYMSFQEKDIHVVFPGMDRKFFIKNPKISQVLNKYKIKSHNYILTVGTKEPRKNLSRVMEAFKTLNNKSLELIIVGKFGWGSMLENFSDDIKVLGYVPESDLPILYQEASCLVYPSLYEGFGFPILEAFASGTNVVTSDRGSIREIGSDFAIYVDPNDTREIANGIKHALQQKFDLNAKKWAATFSWERTAKEVIKIYKHLYNEYCN